MKTRNILWAAAALLLAACNNEEPAATAPAAGKQVQMTFTASAPTGTAATRTTLQPDDGDGFHAVYWNPGDEIGIYSVMEQGVPASRTTFTTDLTEPAPTATFTGEATEGAIQYVAVYPQDLFIACNNMGFTMTVFQLPPFQQATAGSFYSKANIAIASTTDLNGNLTFKNACTLVKFSIKEGCDTQDLESVMLADCGLSPLSGLSWLYAEAGDEVMLESSDGWNPSMTLKGSFEAGKDYYFVVGHEDSSLNDGFFLAFTKNDGTSYVRYSSQGIDKPLVSGTILDLGEIDLSSADYEPQITNLMFIKYVLKSKYSTYQWTYNTNGTLPVTGTNLDNIKQIAEIDNTFTCDKGIIGDLNCLRYFTALETANLSSKDIYSLNLSGSVGLKTLNCTNNYLSELDLSNNVALETLQCGKQEDELGNARELTIILPSSLRDKWENEWKSDTNNEGVIATFVGDDKQDGSDASHDGFTENSWEGNWDN